MIGGIVMAITLLAVDAAEETKFTGDQCRVLKQMGVSTVGICDHIFGPPKKKQRSRFKKKR